MFKVTAILTAFMLLQTSIWAADTSEMKEQVLAACKTQMEQMPEEHKKQGLAMCKCTAEKTDYDALIAGDVTKIQEDALKNAEICAKEAGAM